MTKDERRQRILDRLSYVTNEYTRRKIIGPESGRMRHLIRMYAGQQWGHLGGWGGDYLSNEDRVVVNMIFGLANQFEAEIAAHPPDIRVMPRGRTLKTPEKAQRASALQALIDYDIEELEMQEQANDAAIDHFFAPFGAVRHIFHPGEDLKDGAKVRIRNQRPNKPSLRRYAPWDCFLDPDAQRFTPDGGMRYVFFRDVYSIDELSQNKRIKGLDKLKQIAGDGETKQRDARPTVATGPHAASPDSKDSIELFTYYDAWERTWCIVHPACDFMPLDEDDWPISWETLPVSVFVANQQRHDPFGIPLLDPISDLQDELNKVRTMISWLTRSLKRMIGVDQNRLDPSEMRKLELAMLTEILKTNGPATEVIQQVNAGGLPQELLLYEARITENMREMLGLSLMGRGQRVNVETASEANQIGMGQDVHVLRVLRKYEKFWKHIIKTFVAARRETMRLTGSEVVRLLGVDADGALSYATVSPDDLAAEYDFEVVPGSTRRRDPVFEERQWLARMQLAKESPDLFKPAFYAMKLVESQGVDPRDALTPFVRTAGMVQGVDKLRATASPAMETPNQASAGDMAAILQIPQGNA